MAVVRDATTTKLTAVPAEVALRNSIPMATVDTQMIRPVGVTEVVPIRLGETVTLASGAGTLTIDGERELPRPPGSRATVTMTTGPLRIDVGATGQDQRVDQAELVGEQATVRHRRDQHRHATGRRDRTGIVLVDRHPGVAGELVVRVGVEIGDDADHGASGHASSYSPLR